MLDEAFRDMGDGIYIQSRQSADLFNVAHFRAKTKTTRILMRELLFADYSALVAYSAEEMQKIVDDTEAVESQVPNPQGVIDESLDLYIEIPKVTFTFYLTFVLLEH